MKSFKCFAYASLASVVLFSCQKEILTEQDLRLDLESAANQAQVTGQPEFVPNELLVKFKKGTTAASRGKALGLIGGSIKEHIQTEAMKASGDEEGFFVLNINANALDAVRKAKGLTEVEYAEPNWIYKHQVISNDPSFTNGSLWGMYGSTLIPSNQFGSGASIAWDSRTTDCSTVWVGIIDEGYQYAHSDIAANVAKNPGEIAGNRKDDDRNGYVDDVYGWDFAGRNSSVYDGTMDDHGTHVAGTIGAVGGNGIGVAGVCWKIKLLNAKFLGSTGGTLSNAVLAVDYFTNLKKKYNLNLVATNNSWGGGGFSQSLKDAIDRAGAANILFIAAAGNNGANNDLTPSYPSGYASSNIIAVASINSTGALSSFSQYGAATVDLGAPGEGIISTVPNNTYANYSGTSMATPHVTGAAALYKSLNPSATAAQIKTAILGSSIPTPSLAGKCVTGGRLNVSGF